MRYRWWMVRALPFALLTAGAHPAMAAQKMACVHDLLDERLSIALFQAYRADTPQAVDDGSEDHQSIDLTAMVKARIGPKIMACQRRHRWSDQAVESAARALIGEALASGLWPEIDAAGVRPQALQQSVDDYLQGLDRADLQAFADGEPSEQVVNGLIGRVVADRVADLLTLMVGDAASLIGEFAASRANAIFFAAEFDRL